MKMKMNAVICSNSVQNIFIFTSTSNLWSTISGIALKKTTSPKDRICEFFFPKIFFFFFILVPEMSDQFKFNLNVSVNPFIKCEVIFILFFPFYLLLVVFIYKLIYSFCAGDSKNKKKWIEFEGLKLIQI